MERMREQVLRFGTEIVSGAVTRVDLARRPFAVWTDEQAFLARTLIIATGATAKLLGLESEGKLMGFGVSACATCDGFFFRGKQVMIVGGGDTAMEEALFLTRFATLVTVVHRRDTLRASKIMQDRARANPKIAFLWNSEVIEVLGAEEGKLRGVVLRNLETGAVEERATDGLFIAIGHQPNTEFLRGQLEMDARGYLKVVPGTPRTAIDGVYAAGDVADPTYRQAVTAAGTGCMAAIEAERWLEAQAHAHGAEAGAGRMDDLPKISPADRSAGDPIIQVKPR
jgi:thioredoxin reductase (NADPH)